MSAAEQQQAHTTELPCRADAIAEEMGFPSVAALRIFCERYGIEVQQSSHKTFWIYRSHLRAAMDRLLVPAAPKNTRMPKRSAKHSRSEIQAAADDAIAKGGR